MAGAKYTKAIQQCALPSTVFGHCQRNAKLFCVQWNFLYNLLSTESFSTTNQTPAGLAHATSVFFGKFSQLGKKKKGSCEGYKGGFLEKMGSSHHILRKKILRLSHLDAEVMEVANTKTDSQKVLLSCLTSRQIWLISVVDSCQSTYFTNLRKKQCPQPQ
jgi:hypothetical protein